MWNENVKAFQLEQNHDGIAALKQADRWAQMQKDMISKRLAGLPNNVTTWKYTEQPTDEEGLHFKTDAGGYYTIAEPEQTNSNEPDWDYRTALIYRIFGNEQPMQQYLTQKQAERSSRDSAIYNQYLNMQNKEEQKEKEKEAKALQEQAVKTEKENEKSNYRKSLSDIATSYSSLVYGLEEMKNKGYLTNEEYKQQKAELEKEKLRRQAYDKYSQYKTFANDKEKQKVLTDIAEDKHLTGDDKTSLRNIIVPITSATAAARANAAAGKAGDRAKEQLDEENIENLANKAIKTGNAPADDANKAAVIRALRAKGYTVKGSKVVKK